MKPVKLTAAQSQMLDIARVGFGASAPFYAHYFYSEMTEVFTRDVPTAATDGRRIFINPDYMETLRPMEQVFVYAHEVEHVINRDPQRFKHWNAAGKLRGLPVDHRQFNIAADYRINAGLIEQGVGMMNPAWCYAADIGGDMLMEDVYVKKYQKPPQGQGKGQGQGQGQGQAPGTWGGSGKAPRGAKPDKRALDQGGQDQLMEPRIDPVTGQEDIPDEGQFKEAVARAAAAAKAMGKLPAGLARRIEQMLEPQVQWRERIRMLMTGRIGNRSETWNKPNRRRLALNPMVFMPGRRGYGAELVAVMIDTSGSIGQNELDTFLAEVGGILQDVRPKTVLVIGCDAAVSQVEELSNLDELGSLRKRGVKGGGGTDFRPPFDYLRKKGLRPETAVYLTDMLGPFPEDPGYPVLWAATTDIVGPFGDTVKITVKE